MAASSTAGLWRSAWSARPRSAAGRRSGWPARTVQRKSRSRSHRYSSATRRCSHRAHVRALGGGGAGCAMRPTRWRWSGEVRIGSARATAARGGAHAKRRWHAQSERSRPRAEARQSPRSLSRSCSRAETSVSAAERGTEQGRRHREARRKGKTRSQSQKSPTKGRDRAAVTARPTPRA